MAVEALEQERQFVVFRLAEESYGLSIAQVREIIPLQKVTRVPRTPAHVEGVINLRGRVIPVIDLRARLGLETAEATRDARIVVVEAGDETVGITVDGVSEVLDLGDNAVEPPVGSSAEGEFVRGIARVDERLIMILDLERVFADD